MRDKLHVEVGEEVVVIPGGYGNRHRYTTKVVRVTPTGIIRTTGNIAWKPDGYEQRASAWSRDRIEKMSDEHREYFKRYKLIRSMEDVDWNKVSTEILEHVVSFVKG